MTLETDPPPDATMSTGAASGSALAEGDVITMEVIAEGLAAVMAEMRTNVKRAAYSPVVSMLEDFSCGLFNPEAELIAQGPDHPGHIVPLLAGVRVCMEDFEGRLSPGDILLLNDPYRGGTHLNDVTVLLPLFLDGELFCFPAVRAHWADVGGIAPGSYAGDARNVFYEGVRIPPIKIYERGELNEGAFRILMANMRVPEEREGDLLACVAACRTGERRILELVERYGRDTFLAAVEAHLDRAERRMARQIDLLPDGEYHAEDYLEFFHEGRFDPALMKLRLQVEGSRIVADFRGSSPQLPGVVNSGAAVTLTGVVTALKSALDPSGRVNGGTLRPIECITEPRSIVDVRFDAPANAHGEVRKRVLSVTMAALSRAIPDRVTGDLCGSSFPNLVGGWDDLREKPYVFLAPPAGGNGGFIDGDGPGAMVNVDMGDLRLLPPSEEQESVYPLSIDVVGMRPDSEGAGEHRGGSGAVMRIRLLSQTAEYSVQCDRALIPPWGIFGGESGGPVFNYIETADGRTRRIHTGKITAYPMRQGDVLVVQAAGGGGYGDPLARDPALVAGDVADGYVSAARASEVYGVVLDEAGHADAARTERRREELRSARRSGTVVSDDAGEAYAGILGKHRIQRLAPVWAEWLGVVEGDLIELVPEAGAPVRAWVRFDDSLGDEDLVLDELGRRMLAVGEGDAVRLRVPGTLNSANDLEIRQGTIQEES
jgi:N-methylhydantoinase B